MALINYSLFLDDVREPKDAIYWEFVDSQPRLVEALTVDWVIVRNYDDFVSTITSYGLPIRISFDHDMSPEHYLAGYMRTEPDYEHYVTKTGYDAAKWLVSYCRQKKLTLPLCYVHSFNRIGRDNIFRALNEYEQQ